MTHTQKFILAITLICLTLATGLILSRTGRPYSSALFNLHKLISVAAVVFMIIITRMLSATGAATPFTAGTAAVGAIAAAALIATGALLSIQAEPAGWIFILHRAAPTIVCLAAAALLIIFRQEVWQRG